MTEHAETTRAAKQAIGAVREYDLARLRKRYRAEKRFRWYGIAAIMFACAFLAFLLGDIILRGLPAFQTNTVKLDVTIGRDAVDPANLAAGSYNSIVASAIREKFPAVTSRNDRRALPKLLSLSAVDDVRKAVEVNPALIGSTVQLNLKMSDDADLFYQGIVSDEVALATRGALGAVDQDGTYSLNSSSDDFAAVLARVKLYLEERRAKQAIEASRLERVLEGLRSGLALSQAALNEAGGEAAPVDHPARLRLAKAQSDFDSVSTALGRLSEEVASLTARTSDKLAPEKLEATMPSFFVGLPDGGMLKLLEIETGKATAEAYMSVPVTGEVPAGAWSLVELTQPEADRRLSDREAIWLMSLRDRGLVKSGFNWNFFQRGDSREAEVAGLLGGVVGSALTLIVTLLLALPIGVSAAVYLEEFAPKNRLTSFIEVNINNLAAVPSIVFGLLGLAVFLNFFGLPRSSALVGGMVLALMTLPTIIIAARAAIRAVPPSIREGALGVGASRQQAVFHHVLPLAMPGIFTGTIIGMAQALGETAPLLMIGMVAFIVDVPSGFADAATVLPVQIYLWSDLPEAAFQAKTAGAIMVLLGFLFIMNAVAVVLRRRFERRW